MHAAYVIVFSVPATSRRSSTSLPLLELVTPHHRWFHVCKCQRDGEFPPVVNGATSNNILHLVPTVGNFGGGYFKLYFILTLFFSDNYIPMLSRMLRVYYRLIHLLMTIILSLARTRFLVGIWVFFFKCIFFLPQQAMNSSIPTVMHA